MALQAAVLCLVPVALFAPPKWALLAWLCMTHLDSADTSVAAHAQLGWANALRAVGVPCILYFRFRGVRLPRRFKSAGWLAAGCAGYVLAACLWSVYPLAGLKMATHLIALFIAAAAVEQCALRGALTKGLFLSFLAASLLLALFQTYALGGLMHGREGAEQAVRLTSFATPQQFAALLAALLAIAYWAPEIPWKLRSLAVACLWTAMYFNGSRTWAIAAFLITAITIGLRKTKYLSALCLAGSACAGVLFFAVNHGAGLSDLPLDRRNRLEATIDSLVHSVDTAEDAGLGTSRFRSRLYQGVLEEILASEPTRFLFGHGTSSGGTLVMRIFPRSYRHSSLDPNRVIHNEWLRTLYEWGFSGLLLFSGLITVFYVRVMRIYRATQGNRHAGIMITFFPAFVLGLTVENLMASGGTTVAAAFSLAYGYLALGRRAEAARLPGFLRMPWRLLPAAQVRLGLAGSPGHSGGQIRHARPSLP